jgi:hypothetical protein
MSLTTLSPSSYKRNMNASRHCVILTYLTQWNWRLRCKQLAGNCRRNTLPNLLWGKVGLINVYRYQSICMLPFKIDMEENLVAFICPPADTYLFTVFLGWAHKVPSSELGLSQPLSHQRVCPSPQTKRGGTFACRRGGGGVPILTTGEKAYHSAYSVGGTCYADSWVWISEPTRVGFLAKFSLYSLAFNSCWGINTKFKNKNKTGSQNCGLQCCLLANFSAA